MLTVVDDVSELNYVLCTDRINVVDTFGFQNNKSKDNLESRNVVHGETNLKYRYRGINSGSFLR